MSKSFNNICYSPQHSLNEIIVSFTPLVLTQQILWISSLVGLVFPDFQDCQAIPVVPAFPIRLGSRVFLVSQETRGHQLESHLEAVQSFPVNDMANMYACLDEHRKCQKLLVNSSFSPPVRVSHPPLSSEGWDTPGSTRPRACTSQWD